MKLQATALLLAICGFSGAALGQDDHVAIFKNLTGTLKVIRNDADLNATSGMPLLKSDKVVSMPGASAGIVFKDGTLLTVGSASAVEIRDYVFDPGNAKYAFALYLQKGTAIYIFREDRQTLSGIGQYSHTQGYGRGAGNSLHRQG